MDELEDLLAQHASVTMNLGLKEHSVSRRDALMGQSLAEKDRAEARNFTRRGDGVAPGEPWQCHCCAQDLVTVEGCDVDVMVDVSQFSQARRQYLFRTHSAGCLLPFCHQTATIAPEDDVKTSTGP